METLIFIEPILLEERPFGFYAEDWTGVDVDVISRKVEPDKLWSLRW